MYALIKTGGKQYKVKKDDVIYIEKLNVDEGQTVVFDDVLMLVDEEGNAKIGNPKVEGAKVSAKVLENGKAKKLIVFKYKPKKNYKKKKGHRQLFTKVVITDILGWLK